AAHVEAATAALLTLQRAATRLEALAGASHEALRWLTTAGALWSVAEAPLPLAVAHTLIALAAFEATAPLAAAASALGRQRHAAARLLSGLDAPPLPIEGPPPIGPLTARVLDLQRPGISTPSGEALSFEITAGEAVAIVGPSGAGKTTLARCLVGLAIPTAGRVEIGGVSPIAARGRVALLGQSPRLIEGTARENLELGAAFTPEARAEALRRVGLGGLDEATPLGVDGRRLSGGERQRLALARLLLRRPGLLILDEPTAHLDAATAQALINALVALRATTTLVWITHDPPPWVTQVIRLGSATRPPPAPSPSDAPSSRMNASP
ncbi:ATP-binding cassette domain-containing protein, partial [Myxococcota bacterium]|nr:ATP-binding cassette domain-containing protein [Myxococcota bacterium]